MSYELNNIKAMVFDFDYTLADSSKGVVQCIRYAQGQMGLPLSSDEEILPTIGLSVGDTLAKLSGERERDRVDEFARLFLVKADEVMSDCTEVYDSVPATFAHLQSNQLRIGIASTKYRYRIEAILGRKGLSGFVDVVVGAEDVTEHKPHPACLLQAARHFGLPPASVLYVGDSLPDAGAAQRGGLPFVAVLTGHTAAADFGSYAPLAIFDGIAELPHWVDRFRFSGNGNSAMGTH
ncbi:MAG: HAD-IA family hydrolase [Candidatus Latescibacterota bacterium]|nr:HAD-IA family hydrolase [Candidatus Latescibacterota bacterium]